MSALESRQSSKRLKQPRDGTGKDTGSEELKRTTTKEPGPVNRPPQTHPPYEAQATCIEPPKKPLKCAFLRRFPKIDQGGAIQRQNNLVSPTKTTTATTTKSMKLPPHQRPQSGSEAAPGGTRQAVGLGSNSNSRCGTLLMATLPSPNQTASRYEAPSTRVPRSAGGIGGGAPGFSSAVGSREKCKTRAGALRMSLECARKPVALTVQGAPSVERAASTRAAIEKKSQSSICTSNGGGVSSRVLPPSSTVSGTKGPGQTAAASSVMSTSSPSWAASVTGAKARATTRAKTGATTGAAAAGRVSLLGGEPRVRGGSLLGCDSRRTGTGVGGGSQNLRVTTGATRAGEFVSTAEQSGCLDATGAVSRVRLPDVFLSAELLRARMERDVLDQASAMSSKVPESQQVSVRSFVTSLPSSSCSSSSSFSSAPMSSVLRVRQRQLQLEKQQQQHRQQQQQQKRKQEIESQMLSRQQQMESLVLARELTQIDQKARHPETLQHGRRQLQDLARDQSHNQNQRVKKMDRREDRHRQIQSNQYMTMQENFHEPTQKIEMGRAGRVSDDRGGSEFRGEDGRRAGSGGVVYPRQRGGAKAMVNTSDEALSNPRYVHENMSSIIQHLMGRDKRKRAARSEGGGDGANQGNSESDGECVEVSFQQAMAEENRSKRAGRREDMHAEIRDKERRKRRREILQAREQGEMRKRDGGGGGA